MIRWLTCVCTLCVAVLWALADTYLPIVTADGDWLVMGESEAAEWAYPHTNQMVLLAEMTTATNADGYIHDSSQGSNHLLQLPSAVSGPTWTNEYYYFDGIDDHARTMDEDDFDFDYTNTFSYGCWVRLKSSWHNQWVMGKGPAGSPLQGWWIRYNSNAVNFEAAMNNNWGPGNQAFASSKPVSTGTWYHLLITFDGATSMTMYLDGDASVCTSGAFNLTGEILQDTNIFLGGHAGWWGNYLEGDIDVPQVWSNCLTGAEVGEIYTNTLH